LAASVSTCDRPDLLHKRWTDRPHGEDPPFPSVSKEDAAKLFTEWFQQLPADHTAVFSDGSMDEKAKGTGWGYSIWRGGREIAHGHGRPRTGEVFDAEATGAYHGLKVALALPDTREITACVDNQANIWCLTRNPSKTSFWEFKWWHDMADAHEWKVDVKWSPGHMGIEGNERADKMANLGLKDLQTERGMTLARVRRGACKASREQYNTWWLANRPARYASLLGVSEEDMPQQRGSRHEKNVLLEAEFKCPESLKLPRQSLARWLMTRSAHGPYKAYHDLRHHADAPRDCSCGRPRTPEHIAHCAKMRRKISIWSDHPNWTKEEWFDSMVEDYELFTKVDLASGFYTRICPTTPTWRKTKQKFVPRPKPDLTQGTCPLSAAPAAE
jgi:ribonuclease HI